MDNQLAILVTGKVVLNKKLINDEIAEIESKINKLNIKIDFGDLNNINNQINDLKTKLNTSLGDIHLVDEKKLKKEVTKIDSAINEAIKRAKLKYGNDNIVSVGKIFDPKTDDLKGFTLYLENAEKITRQITYNMAQFEDGVKFEQVGSTELDKKEKALIQFEKEQQKVIKNYQELVRVGRLSDDQIGSLENAINSSKNIDDLEKAKVIYKDLADEQKRLRDGDKERERVLQEEHKINDKLAKIQEKDLQKQQQLNKTLIGTYKELQAEQLDSAQVADILSKEYGNLEIRERSLNQITGEYSVTLKKSAKENLILKGHVDSTTGSIYNQSKIIKQASTKNLGMIEQFKIALSRVKFNAPYVSNNIRKPRICWKPLRAFSSKL